MTISRDKLNQLLENLRAQKAAESTTLTQEKTIDYSSTQNLNPSEIQVIDKYGKLITLNSKQSEFVRIAGREGKSAVLIGAAGTGKTTTQYAVVQELIQSGRAGVLQSDGHKYLTSGTPGIVVCAYTRRAVANIKRNMPADMQENCITIHKLLEYQPVYYEVEDPETGETKTTMKFEATRNASRPLPSSIHTIIYEEGSMLGIDLHKEVSDACPHQPQVIYLGDIQQLPPVFGPAILGFKLLELPVVELTEVYRQALESPIISLAHRILSGKPLPYSEFDKLNVQGKLKLHPWKKKVDPHNAMSTISMFFVGNVHSESDPKKQVKGAFQNGFYDPDEDMILMPFNESFGTIELNKKIGNALAKHRGAEVYEIIAGFERVYFSIGEKVLYDKEDAVILDIQPNPAYYGAPPKQHSKTLDYWGYDSEAAKKSKAEMSDEDVDFMLAQVSMAKDGDKKVHQCSHIVTLQMKDSEVEVKVDKGSEVKSMLLGYALTVHKSQGSEWRKVFFLSHQSNATMLQRELLYTAVTRAREELYIICEPEMFEKGITSQRVKGNTLAEKAEFFKGKKETINSDRLT